MTRKEEIKQAAYSQFCNSSSVTFGLACEAFEKGAEWGDRTMIEKACEWLRDNLPNWVDSYKEFAIIEDFRKAMVN